QAGDVADFVSLGSGNWICTNYERHSYPTTTISGSAATTITVSGLDSNYTGGYKVYGFIIGVSLPNLYIELNGDTTTSNYPASQALLGSSYSQTTTDALIGALLSDSGSVDMTIIQNPTTGRVHVSSRVQRSAGNIYLANVAYSVTDNLTSIAISSSGTGIGVGSTLTVQRL
ncbi:MAG: hypothetical protein ACWGN2_11785, partial [Anaerolineales bacterium]